MQGSVKPLHLGHELDVDAVAGLTSPGSSGALNISRAEGAGGSPSSQLVAERLSARDIDDEIIPQAAAPRGICPGDVADEEKRKSALSRMAREFGRAAVPDSYGIAGMSHPYEEVSSEASEA